MVLVESLWAVTSASQIRMLLIHGLEGGSLEKSLQVRWGLFTVRLSCFNAVTSPLLPQTACSRSQHNLTFGSASKTRDSHKDLLHASDHSYICAQKNDGCGPLLIRKIFNGDLPCTSVSSFGSYGSVSFSYCDCVLSLQHLHGKFCAETWKTYQTGLDNFVLLIEHWLAILASSLCLAKATMLHRRPGRQRQQSHSKYWSHLL